MSLQTKTSLLSHLRQKAGLQNIRDQMRKPMCQHARYPLGLLGHKMRIRLQGKNIPV